MTNFNKDEVLYWRNKKASNIAADLYAINLNYQDPSFRVTKKEDDISLELKLMKKVIISLSKK